VVGRWRGTRSNKLILPQLSEELPLEEKSLAFFKNLLETPSPSGYEMPVQELVRGYAAGFADADAGCLVIVQESFYIQNHSFPFQIAANTVPFAMLKHLNTPCHSFQPAWLNHLQKQRQWI